MKKKSGSKRALNIIPFDELDGISTPALLARLKRLRWCEESRHESDILAEEISSVKGMILFKDTPEWKQAYRDIKSILALREHLPKAG